MRLTTFSDYCMRVLMYVGTRPDRLSTIDEIAECYGISRNHLMKVVYRLGQLGYLDTVRGKNGGLRIAKDPAEIGLGELFRLTEEELGLVQCFRSNEASCRIEPACVLKSVLGEALAAFMAVLDRYTVADLIRPETGVAKLLGVPDLRPGGAVQGTA